MQQFGGKDSKRHFTVVMGSASFITTIARNLPGCQATPVENSYYFNKTK